ncbi:hypothetical protein [Streptomyces sp. Je 1-332]|uniref:hypothetical protein n=1 Tax=Streptomyces sp. Je 1-332 TaxID=3231270 RepID=UPI003458279A
MPLRRSLVAGGAAAALMFPTSLPAAFAADRDGPLAPSCSWSERGYRYGNSAYPETAARYWVLRFKKQDGLTIRINGRYPDARYSSVNVYDSTASSFTANGVSSGITDHRIAPDPGSRNPWRERAAHGGKFTVRVTDSARRDTPNTVPMAPTGTPELSEGSVLFRTYRDSSPVDLPEVTFEKNGESVVLPLCEDANAPATPTRAAAGTTGTAAAAGADTSEPAVAFRRKSGANLYPNADAAYVSAEFTPPGPGRVLLVRGKAPTTVRADHPRPWPTAHRTDVRYWSLCDNVVMPPGPVVVNPLPDGTVSTGCRNDKQVKVAPDSTYTFVIGAETQRSRIEEIPGATFLPVSTAHHDTTHLLVMRHLIPGAHFRHAVQNVPVDSTPAAARKVMGAYYPTAAYCSLDRLTAKGLGRGCRGGH